MTILLVAIGAALGAPLRYLLDRAVQARHESVFPWGTFVVNIAGSFVLGVLTGLSVAGPLMAAAGTGFCGALTTYSTFGYETVRLTQEGARFTAVVNAVASIGAGLGAGCAGLFLGRALG